MIKITFLDEEILALQKLQEHTNPFVRRRALILILKNEHLFHHKIARIVGVSEDTVRNCLKLYQKGSVERIQTLNPYRPQGRLKPFESKVKEYFEKTPPVTIAQACSDIEKLTGVSVKNTQMCSFIDHLCRSGKHA